MRALIILKESSNYSEDGRYIFQVCSGDKIACLVAQKLAEEVLQYTRNVLNYCPT